MITTAILDKAIYDITGIAPVFKKTDDGFSFTLGVNQPVEIGFDMSKHPDITEDNVRWSCRVKMIEVISQYLKTPEPFEQWINLQAQN